MKRRQVLITWEDTTTTLINGKPEPVDFWEWLFTQSNFRGRVVHVSGDVRWDHDEWLKHN